VGPSKRTYFIALAAEAASRLQNPWAPRLRWDDEDEKGNELDRR
jgi:hypothetical protein